MFSFFFFSPFCTASIVTVIRLVNDAVDNIESEGTEEHPVAHLLLLCLPPVAKGFSGVTLEHTVNGTDPLLFNPYSIQKRNSIYVKHMFALFNFLRHGFCGVCLSHPLIFNFLFPL